MIIGFDAKRAVNNFTGLGNYSRLVIDALASALPDDRLLLYAPRLRHSSRLAPVLAHGNVEMRLPRGRVWPRVSGVWRVQRGITSDVIADGVGLFHGLSNELPLDISRAGIPTVVTIHDLIFKHFTRGYKRADRLIYDFKFRRAAETATRVIAVSEATRRDIISSYGIAPDKIDVVYQGCDAGFLRPVTDCEIAAVRCKYSLPERYIVSVGTIEPRKNQMLTLAALPQLPHDVKAVIVGRATAYMDELTRFVREKSLGERVVFVHDAPFADLPALYAGATVAAYTSRMEGFGIPVIEAINCGTPVVACTGTCLEEAGGPGALYVHPDDVEEMAFAVNRLLDDASLRTAMVDAGRGYVARFTPAKFTADLLSVYRKALGDYR